MNIKGHLHDALTNLMLSKMRSILAILGILIGTASVVAMVSGGQLATNQALNEFKTLGTDLLSVSIGRDISSNGEQSEGSSENSSAKNANVKLTPEAALKIKNSAPDIIDVAPYTNVYSNVSFKGRAVNVGALGVTEDFLLVAKLRLKEGRFIRYFDNYSAFCVLGASVYDQLKAYSLNPMGQQISIGDSVFTIIGVLQPWQENSFIYANVNESIFIPIQASMAMNKYAEISSLVIQLKPNANIEATEAAITDKISAELPESKLYFQSAKQLLKSMENQRAILTIFLGLIGSISLLVGGIGIMNIMLVSVTERRREIGIRLAIGAKKRDIQILFLVESVNLSLFGGIFGVLIGVLVSFILAEIKGWEFTLYFTPPIIGFVVSVCVGIFFGFYPAYKASKLDPIETLRSE